MVDSEEVDTAEICAAGADLLESRVTPTSQRAMLAASACDPRLWQEFAAMGWFSLTLPAPGGGLGIAPLALGPLFTMLGRHLVPGALIEQMVLPAVIAAAAGDRWPVAELEAATAGQLGLCFADPGAGDASAGAAGPHWQEDGTINGRVDLVLAGPTVDRVLVSVGTGPQQALLLVDVTHPRVSFRYLRSADPTTRVGGLVLDRAVPGDHLVLARGRSAELIVEGLRTTYRVLLAHRLAGVARWALDATVGYVVQRTQFDRPIGSFQAVKHIAAEMAMAVISVENLCRATTQDVLAATDPAVAELASLTLKASASDIARSVCEGAIQLHGGVGFTAEHLLGSYYRHALSMEHWYGGSRDLWPVIGTRLLSSSISAT